MELEIIAVWNSRRHADLQPSKANERCRSKQDSGYAGAGRTACKADSRLPYFLSKRSH